MPRRSPWCRTHHRCTRCSSATASACAADKDAAKAGAGQEVVILTGDTTTAVSHLGKASVDVVVTDLPYGVQHGSQGAAGLRRSPADLLVAALPAWRSVLRPGGAVGLSWNTKVLPRAELVAVLAAAGLTAVTGDGFAHRVDQ